MEKKINKNRNAKKKKEKSQLVNNNIYGLHQIIINNKFTRTINLILSFFKFD